MISSPQPNEATANSDSNNQRIPATTLPNNAFAPTNGDSSYRTTTISPLSPQLDSSPRREQHVERAFENGQAVRQAQLRRANWWQKRSLRTKATTLAIALGVLPVLAIGTINYFLSSKDIRKDAIEAQQSLTISFADELGRFMFERHGDIEILRSLRVFTDPVLRETTSRQEKEAQLKRFQDVYGVYDSIGLFDLNGNVIVKTGGEVGKNSQGQIANNIYDRDHFQAVIKTDRTVISQPSVSKTTGKISIFLAAPVKDTATGKTIAVVRTRMPVEVLDKLLQAEESAVAQGVKTFSQVEYHVVDASGKIFVAKEKDEVGRDARADFSSFAQMQAANKVTSAVDVHQANQAKQLISYNPVLQLQGIPELNLGILVAEDTEIAFAAQRRLLLTLMLGTGLTALIVGAIAAYLASLATRPILSAADAVKKLGQGELDARTSIKGEDEFAVLGSNINLMADQLQDLLQKQEAETERTKLFAEIASARGRDAQDLESIFNKAVTGARELLKADRVVVYRFKPDWSGYITAESVLPGWPKALADKIDDPCIGKDLIEAYRNGRVVPTNNVFETNYAPDHMKLLERLEVKASLVTPILQNDQLLGLLVAHHCSSPHAWQQSEINFLSQLAVQVGLCVDRVASLEQQRTAKEQLQKRALELLMEVEPISKGDLTIRANVTEDEIGTLADSYNATVGSLRKIVTTVQTAAQQVAATTSSSEVSVLELSKEALRQTEEITAALDQIQEMSNSIRAVATSAKLAEAAVKQATQTVEAGDSAMNRTVDGILAIRETVAETSKKVKRLGESSQKISQVVNLIGTFADKTNLLALNASIEAAHAGEQGRGFAVVADQVRALARQSAQATAEIESLVKDIQTETNSVVAAMEAGTEQVVTGTKLVDETRQSLNKITAVSAQISELVEAIASNAVAQSQVSEQVTQTMSDVAAIANQTSSEATHVSASFKELLAVATQLQTSAAKFKVS